MFDETARNPKPRFPSPTQIIITILILAINMILTMTILLIIVVIMIMNVYYCIIMTAVLLISIPMNAKIINMMYIIVHKYSSLILLFFFLLFLTKTYHHGPRRCRGRLSLPFPCQGCGGFRYFEFRGRSAAGGFGARNFGNSGGFVFALFLSFWCWSLVWVWVWVVSHTGTQH